MYFWLSFIPAIVSKQSKSKLVERLKFITRHQHSKHVFVFVVKLVMLVGTKLEHVVSKLALEVKEQQTGTSGGGQVKPRDGLFWFGKPEILLRLIQFIIFQVNKRIFSFSILQAMILVYSHV